MKLTVDINEIPLGFSMESYLKSNGIIAALILNRSVAAIVTVEMLKNNTEYAKGVLLKCFTVLPPAYCYFDNTVITYLQGKSECIANTVILEHYLAKSKDDVADWLEEYYASYYNEPLLAEMVTKALAYVPVSIADFENMITSLIENKTKK